ncbi:histidine phosphatase family protein [Xanthobacter sp. DSM 24535]|uniref:histidine phosphatase family protein n=1 Tax=Roseixanthobacter psychrophilus TaxID=3119917 RepID=UPI0037280A30
MTTILLTRHGHVPGIAPERFRGRMEVALSPLGEQEAQAVAARIAATWKPVKVYTSTLGRCIATGAAIAAACGIASEADEALCDIDYGQWQWQTHEEAKAAFPDLYALWHTAPQLMRFPGGESLQDLAVRAADLVRRIGAAHAGETVVLVGHDSVNRVLLTHLLDQPLSSYWKFAQDPCNLNLIAWSGTSARLLRLNDTAHLQGLTAG